MCSVNVVEHAAKLLRRNRVTDACLSHGTCTGRGTQPRLGRVLGRGDGPGCLSVRKGLRLEGPHLRSVVELCGAVEVDPAQEHVVVHLHALAFEGRIRKAGRAAQTLLLVEVCLKRDDHFGHRGAARELETGVLLRPEQVRSAVKEEGHCGYVFWV